MKYQIKIVYNIEDQEYCVFISGISGIEGYGKTEQEAIEDFYKNLHNKTKE